MPFHIISRPLPLAALLVFPLYALADSELAPVVVEDERPATTTTLPASRFVLPQSVAAATTLSREEIAAIRPRDVYDLIEAAPGMSISRQGARVHNFSFDRGDSVSLILDGVYLTQTEAQRVLGDLPPELIESIRFVRDATLLGVAPLMGFGAAAAGSPTQGYILITTRRGQGRESELRAGYASYDTWKGSAFHSQSWLDGRATLALGYQHSASAGKTDWNNAYRGDSWLLNGAWHDDGFSAGVSFYANQAAREIQRAIGTYTGKTAYPASGPTPAGVLDKNIWQYDPMNHQVLAINLAREWNERHSTLLTFGQSEASGTQYAYTTTSAAASVSGKAARDRATEWNLAHAVSAAANTLKVGLQAIEWYQLSEGNPVPRREAVYGAYLSDEYRVNDSWTLDAALRADRKQILQGGDKYLADGSKVRLSDGEWTDQARLWSFGTAWQIDPVWRLAGRYARSLTPMPDVLTTRDNAELPAERRSRYELAVEARFDRALALSLTPFYYDIHNAKVSDGTISSDNAGNPILDPASGLPTSIAVYKAANRIRHGFELGLSGRLGSAFSYQVGWTHFTDDRADGVNGSEFPDNKLSAALDWRQEAWRARLSALQVDPYLSYGYMVGGFTTLNLSVSRQFAGGISLTLYGQNLTDEHYATNNKGYPATANWGVLRDVGRTIGIEMGVQFQ